MKKCQNGFLLNILLPLKVRRRPELSLVLQLELGLVQKSAVDLWTVTDGDLTNFFDFSDLIQAGLEQYVTCFPVKVDVNFGLVVEQLRPLLILTWPQPDCDFYS